MWKNFIRVTVRSISKNKLFNIINISGLAIGLASAIFIILYIISETSYDRFNTRASDIYRLYVDGKMMQAMSLQVPGTAPVFGPTFHEDIPEIEAFCRFDFRGNQLMWVEAGQQVPGGPDRIGRFKLLRVFHY